MSQLQDEHTYGHLLSSLLRRFLTRVTRADRSGGSRSRWHFYHFGLVFSKGSGIRGTRDFVYPDKRVEFIPERSPRIYRRRWFVPFFQGFRRGFIFLSPPGLLCAYPGDKFGKEYDEKVTTYRERFENIIKTEGEDSGPPGSGGHWPLSSSFYPAPHAPLPAHVVAGHHSALPVQPGLGVHAMDEKKQMRKGRGAAVGVV